MNFAVYSSTLGVAIIIYLAAITKHLCLSGNLRFLKKVGVEIYKGSYLLIIRWSY
jgi:hypothetical protein